MNRVESSDRDRALMTVKQVAAVLNCSPRHLRRLADRGAMPQPVRVGKLVRWRRYEIQQWIDAGCPSGPATKRG